MVSLRTEIRLWYALKEGKATGYHHRCGGEVRLDLNDRLFCDGCEFGIGWVIPETDENEDLIIINGIVRVCFEKKE